MRIRATCHACNRDFLFFQLRHGDPWTTDRCPHCDRPLGVRGVLAVRAEQALAVFIHSLEELGRHHPDFTVRETSVLAPIEDALEPLTASPAASERFRPPRWWNRPKVAA
jgi:hypothetical protein